MTYSAHADNIVTLRLRDVPGIPRDLAPITIVYTLGEAQDVLVTTDDAEQVLRLECVSPLEQEALRVALIYAEPLRNE